MEEDGANEDENDNKNAEDSSNTSLSGMNAISNIVAVENRSDEMEPPGDENEVSVEHITRSGRASRQTAWHPATFMTEGSEGIDKWSEKEQCQLRKEALGCRNYQINETKAMCFKEEQMSIQKGTKKHGDAGKTSAMKEMRNLPVKNECSG